MNNTISDNYDTGLLMEGNCNYNTISNNDISNNMNWGGIALFDQCNNNTISNNIITNQYNNRGLFLSNCHYNTISENVISGEVHNGVAIESYYSNDNIIFGNTIHDYSEGMYMLYCNYTKILENTYYRVGPGMYLTENYYCVIQGNNISDSYGGESILLDTCSYNKISDNFIDGNNAEGIMLEAFNNYNIITNNYITGCLGGIIIGGSHNIVLNNTIASNFGYGIAAYENYNIISMNVLINNSENAIDIGYHNNWDDGIIGNYWDDYTGVDVDDDGIGDTPYIIPGLAGSQDNFPIWEDGINDPVQYKWHSTWGLKEYQDWGNAMVLDSVGNIYVVGTTLDQLNYQERGYDICLVKFDSLGVIQWNRTWGGTISEEGMGIALDSNENVYIVGFTQGSQMVLLKYDSSGVLQWNLTRSGGYFYAITIDSSDNIFITGTLGHDLGLWKYDTAGVEQWVRTWGGPIYGVPEHGRGITLDSSGNIYIVGDTRSFGAGSYDACLLKYDSSGVLQWYRTWGENRWDRGNAISVDSYDNIYITGFTTISEVNDANDAFLAKYSRSGVQIWNRTWGGFYTDIMYAITLDSSGYIYLAGRLGISYGKSHVYLVIYDRMGEQRWNRTWGDKYYDHANAIALDSSGDIYLAGSTSDYIDIPVGNQYVYDMLLMKYDCNLPPPPPDTSPPATAIAFSGTPGLNDWFVSEVSVALTADANSGVDYTEYGFDGTNWFLYAEPFLITIEGETTIYYRSVDNAGHVESTRKRILKIDYTPPVTAIELNGTLEMNEWFSSDVLVTLSATDDISGFDHSEYSYDGINWHLYSGPFVISLEGDITVYYRSTDIAGNTEIAQSVNFKIVRLPSKIVEEVITILENLEVPSEAQSDINKAIYDLNRAIIKFENGKFYRAFFKIQYALEHLMCAEINGADVQEPIDILVSLVQGFADDGIEDAIEMVGEDNEFVIRALEKYDIALQKLSNEKYDKAVKYFRLAFKNAMKARVKWIPESFLDDLMDRIADIQELKEGEEISSCALDCLNSAENKIYAAITKANNSAFALSFYKLSDAICFLLEAQDYGVDTNFLINSIMSNINDMVYLKISDAESVLVGADSGLIETAWTKYYNAQDAWENGNYFTAIERYILALEKAEDALLPID
jgi:parallel beta-helix repeat protein